MHVNTLVFLNTLITLDFEIHQSNKHSSAEGINTDKDSDTRSNSGIFVVIHKLFISKNIILFLKATCRNINVAKSHDTSLIKVSLCVTVKNICVIYYKKSNI